MGKDLKGKELGERFKQNKDGGYEFRFKDWRGIRVSVYARDMKTLQEKAAKKMADSLAGRTIKDASVTLDDWFNSWLDLEKYAVIRDTTRLGYRRVYEKHISPVLGEKKLKDISRLDIQRLIKSLSKAGLGFATQNRVKILLGDMLDKAVKHDLLLKSVVRGVTVRRDEKGEPRFLTVTEKHDFFEAAKGTFYYNLFVTAVESGLRPGELYALTEADLDFDKNLISVTKTLHYSEKEGEEDKGKQYFYGPTKTESSERRVPMSIQCKEALQAQLKLRAIVAGRYETKHAEFKDVIFTSSLNNPLNAQTCLDAINRVLNELNSTRDSLEQLEPFSMHSFRHTFATDCLESGIALKVVQGWMGHADLAMTASLYTHVSDDFSQDEMQKKDGMQSLVDNSKVIPLNKDLRSGNGVVGDSSGVEDLLKDLIYQVLEEKQERKI